MQNLLFIISDKPFHSLFSHCIQPLSEAPQEQVMLWGSAGILPLLFIPIMARASHLFA